MMRKIARRATARLLVALLALTGAVLPFATATAESTRPRTELGPLAHTYSIVARDPVTGDLGVAVQSHWFQVGPVVPWARSGVGAVATQSFVEVSYGPRGLDLMAAGKSPQQALDQLLEADEQRAVRQVAMVDAEGRVAAWTGESCIPAAGHRAGDGYSVQANLMDRATVWDAMAQAYERSAGQPFAERLLAALEAAEAEGGDIRGKQSAAILIVAAEATRGEAGPEPWRDRKLDLRIDDHPDPLAELRRLYELHLAYEAMNAGDEAVAAGEMDRALERYSEAAERAPHIVELPYWQAVTLVGNDRLDEALPIFRRVFAAEERWIELTRRLPGVGLLPDDPEVVTAILAVAPGAAGDAVLPDEATLVEGELTAEGVECQALRADDGTLYTLVGDLGEFSTGDDVRVIGVEPAMSICMQGTTLEVLRIRPAG